MQSTRPEYHTIVFSSSISPISTAPRLSVSHLRRFLSASLSFLTDNILLLLPLPLGLSTFSIPLYRCFARMSAAKYSGVELSVLLDRTMQLKQRHSIGCELVCTAAASESWPTTSLKLQTLYTKAAGISYRIDLLELLCLICKQHE